jgi:hypothetical protein
MANYYEAVVAKAGKENAKAAANWMMGDVSSALNRADVDILESPVEASQLALLLKRIADGTISNNAAKKVFAPDVGSEVGRRKPGRHHHRARRPEADLGHRRAGRHRRRSPGQRTPSRSSSTAPARKRRSTR